jgi:UTP--glucose-1-phosphate uridylyltransferase
MDDAGTSPTARVIFADNWLRLAGGETGLVAEADVEPLAEAPSVDPEPVDAAGVAALAATALIRLNGGLGTSMGLARAKALIPVRGGLNFLDAIVRQVLFARRAHGVSLPLVFMNSFRTREDTLEVLARYPDLAVGGIPLDMVQSQEPKLRIEDLYPIDWPADRELEWCPPGHGDLYPTLLDSGVLEALIGAGYRYANVANSDNLGAAPSPALAGWFAQSGAPFAAEITARTEMDLKGGHIVRRRRDGRLVLRETAQTAAEEMRYFTDARLHPFTNTNNVWFDLRALAAKLAETGGVLGLPIIRNVKSVDPADSATPTVIQLETAMGAAIEVFEGARVVVVPRRRFLPVKTTSDLALLRSDVYRWGADGIPRGEGAAPVLEFDSHYSALADFEARLPYPLGLAGARGLSVEGDWWFGQDVAVVGSVELGPPGGRIADGTVLEGATPEPAP